MEIKVRGYGKAFSNYKNLIQSDYILKDKIREHLKKLNISDIEPWSIYKISGDWLFELEELLK